MENISITEEPGCFSALFGGKRETTSFNMLVFSNENDNIITDEKLSNPKLSNQNLSKLTVLNNCKIRKSSFTFSGTIEVLKKDALVTFISKHESFPDIYLVETESGKQGYCDSFNLSKIKK